MNKNRAERLERKRSEQLISKTAERIPTQPSNINTKNMFQKGYEKVKNMVNPAKPKGQTITLKNNSITAEQLNEMISNEVQKMVISSMQNVVPAVFSKIQEQYVFEENKRKGEERRNRRNGVEDLSTPEKKIEYLIKNKIIADTKEARKNALYDYKKHTKEYDAYIDQIQNGTDKAEVAKKRIEEINIKLPKSREAEMEELSQEIRSGAFANSLKIAPSDKLAFATA